MTPRELRTTSLLLFVLGAWPLLLPVVPPLQDLPNHLATVHILLHPDRFPELVGSGFFKTNTALFAWSYLLAPHVGLVVAVKAFLGLSAGVWALVLPRFVAAFAGPDRARSASLFAWPLVHSWFVSMGMLNYALSLPLVLLLLVVLDRQRRRPTLARGALAAAIALGTWFVHVFPIIVAGCLCLCEALREKDTRKRLRAAFLLCAPLAPTGLLTVGSALAHVVKIEGSPSAGDVISFSPLHRLVANVWENCLPGFTWLSAAPTLLPALSLPVLAFRNRREAPPFFSPVATVLVMLGYVLLPGGASNWWYLNTRLIPFIWFALLVRAPARLPRGLGRSLVVAAGVYTVALGVDYLRLDRDRAAYTAGMAAVPEGASLLPLSFESRVTSEFTASAHHLWGFYTMERSAHVPLVFAVERSYPLLWKQFPPAQLVPPALDNFARLARSPEVVCAQLRAVGVAPADCEAAWRERWRVFLDQAAPRFDHVLTWVAPPELERVLGARYERVFAKGPLEIWRRRR